MSQYQKPCIFCKQEIKMSNDSGNWLPYNLDGSIHECRPSTKYGKGVEDSSRKQDQYSVPNDNKLTLESLGTRLKKVESILYGESSYNRNG
jgi:hypothetical protein